MGLNLLIMGPPGAGKGTQAAVVADEFGLTHLATGDILRKEVAAGSSVGTKAKAFMDRGSLVPDEVMVELVGEHVVKAARATGFLLDGFPRTVSQADSLGALLEKSSIAITAVLNLEVPEETLIRRLANRLTCPKDQRTYHPVNHPPRKAGVCDECGTVLITRDDDTEAVIRQRLTVYRENTAPLIAYYEAQGFLHPVDGTPAVADITASIKAFLTGLESRKVATREGQRGRS